MEKKLPHIYSNNENITSNNRKFYYSDIDEEKSKNDEIGNNTFNNNKKDDILERYNLKTTLKENNISTKIINIFKNSNSIYKIKVKLIINGKSVEKYLIGRTNSTLITIDGETIDIKTIDDIEPIN